VDGRHPLGLRGGGFCARVGRRRDRRRLRSPRGGGGNHRQAANRAAGAQRPRQHAERLTPAPRRGGPPPRPPTPYLLVRLNRVGQRAQAGDFHRDAGARHHPRGTGRRTGADHIARQQGERGGYPLDDLRDVLDHLVRVRVLLGLGLPVVGQVCLDGQAVDVDAVDVRLDPWAQRAEAVQALRAGPLTVSELQVAGADVVDDGEAQDDVLPVVTVDVLARSSDDDGELALELDTGGPLRDADRGFGADDGCRGLQEDGRREVLRALLEDLLDVVGIVAAHGNDLAGKDRREQPNLLDRPRLAGELRLAEWVISDFAAGGAGAVRLATLK